MSVQLTIKYIGRPIILDLNIDFVVVYVLILSTTPLRA